MGQLDKDFENAGASTVEGLNMSQDTEVQDLEQLQKEL